MLRMIVGMVKMKMRGGEMDSGGGDDEWWRLRWPVREHDSVEQAETGKADGQAGGVTGTASGRRELGDLNRSEERRVGKECQP